MLPLPPEYAIDTGTAAIARRRDTVEVPVFWIVLVLSVLVHVAVLYFVPPLRLAVRPGLDPKAPLAVDLRPLPPAKAPESAAPAPKPKSIPPVAVAPRPAPPRPAPPSPRVASPAPPPSVARPAPPAPSSPPVITQPAPEPRSPIARAEPPAPVRVQKPPGGDLSSYIEARRRARGEPPSAVAPSSAEPAPADEEARRNQIVAQNLGLDRAPVFGGPPKQGGGIFQITSLHYSNAEFLFFGWNKDIRRNTTQLIEVRKGEHSDIKVAVIRRMIAIIREHESGDFLWESPRLGRNVTLSARPADNAGLEEFLMREFFGEPRPALGTAGRGAG